MIGPDDSRPRTNIRLPALLLAMLLSAGLWVGLYWAWRALSIVWRAL